MSSNFKNNPSNCENKNDSGTENEADNQIDTNKRFTATGTIQLQILPESCRSESKYTAKFLPDHNHTCTLMSKQKYAVFLDYSISTSKCEQTEDVDSIIKPFNCQGINLKLTQDGCAKIDWTNILSQVALKQSKIEVIVQKFDNCSCLKLVGFRLPAVSSQASVNQV